MSTWISTTLRALAFISLVSLAAATLPVEAMAPAGGATLADFAWLAGHWRGALGNLEAEQTYSQPAGGVMMGMFRLREAERVVLLEFFTLRETPEGLEMRVRHFSPALDLGKLEEKQAIILKLTSYNGVTAVFDNPVHTRPKHSTLIRTGPDAFTGRSQIILETGEEKMIEVNWRRVSPQVADNWPHNPAPRRVIRKEVTVGASLAEVWNTWTTEEGVTSFFGPQAHVEPVLGGPYEIYFDPNQPYGLRGSEGCKVHSVVPMELFAFEWNAPPSIPAIRNSGLHSLVFVRFKELGPDETHVGSRTPAGAWGRIGTRRWPISSRAGTLSWATCVIVSLSVRSTGRGTSSAPASSPPTNRARRVQ